MPSLWQAGQELHVRLNARAGEINTGRHMCNANQSTEYASILKIIRTPEPTASEDWEWPSGSSHYAWAALRAGTTVSLLSASPFCPVHLNQAWKKTNRAVLAFKTANKHPRTGWGGIYSDCGRADYVVSGICIFWCANCLDVFKYGCT